MTYIVYKISYVDEDDPCAAPAITQSGTIAGEDLNDAIDNLFNYYGSANIVRLVFDVLEEDCPVEFSNKTRKEILDGDM